MHTAKHTHLYFKKNRGRLIITFNHAPMGKLHKKQKNVGWGKVEGDERQTFWAENDVCMSGYIIVRWTLRVSPLEGYRERHEYQTFSLQSCAAYFHSLNVIMKPQYSCPCPARPSTAIKSILRDLSAPTPSTAVHKCSDWASVRFVWGPHLLPSNPSDTDFPIKQKKRC